MNRVKKELRKRGVKLESDYPTLPFFVKGKSCFEPGYIFVDGVTVNSETATAKIFYNVIVAVVSIKRDGSLEESYED